MNKLLAIAVIAALPFIGGCAERYHEQNWYPACKMNPNASYENTQTGVKTKCSDMLGIRR